jgi:hypothetical protein
MLKIERREVPMIKRILIYLTFAIWLVDGGAFLPRVAWADMEWKIIKSLDLKTTPLDVTPSVDGKWLFILTPGEILLYSLPEGKITERIPIDKEFDRITSLPKADMLTVSSSTKKTLQIMLFVAIYKIDLVGLPFKGPSDAAVTLVVFDDYQ